MIYDTFPYRDEADILECRLYELRRVPNLIHVAVEADVDHQGRPKEYTLEPRPRLRVVRATGLPTVAEDPDPWAREHAQREECWKGMKDAKPDDVVLHGDVDEIPRADVVAGLTGPACLEMSLHCFAVDWVHPDPWLGTAATCVGDVKTFTDLRMGRHRLSAIPDAGWHLSWLGGLEAARHKMGSWCHPEIEAQWPDPTIHLATAIRNGVALDGTQMAPTTGPWPQWVTEGRSPATWRNRPLQPPAG